MQLLRLPVVLFALWLVCFAPWISLLHWVFDWPFRLLLLASVIATPAYTFVSFRALRKGPDRLAHASMQFLGLGSVVWPFLVPLWLANLVLPSQLVALAFALLWIVIAIFASINARRLHDVHLEINDDRIAQPLKVVQISDVHVGSRSRAFLDTVVDRVLSHQPDMVLITGDLLDLSRVTSDDLSPLSRIEQPVYMCIGNHERYVDFENALQSIGSQSVTVLRDELIEDQGIQIIGIDDADNADRVATVLAALKPATEQFTVVLYHRPDGWDFVKQYNLPLMLAGHTHNGQVWPFNWLVKWQYPNIAGLYEKNGNQLYVSCGTGTWGPVFRLGSKCEVTVFKLSP